MTSTKNNLNYLNSRRLLIGLLSATALTATAVPSYAQIEEIVVTARKTEENLQDVPISVTALPGAALKDAGITEFPQIAQVTPNFDVRSDDCLLYTSPSPRDQRGSRMPSSA